MIASKKRWRSLVSRPYPRTPERTCQKSSEPRAAPRCVKASDVLEVTPALRGPGCLYVIHPPWNKLSRVLPRRVGGREVEGLLARVREAAFNLVQDVLPSLGVIPGVFDKHVVRFVLEPRGILSAGLSLDDLQDVLREAVAKVSGMCWHCWLFMLSRAVLAQLGDHGRVVCDPRVLPSGRVNVCVLFPIGTRSAFFLLLTSLSQYSFSSPKRPNRLEVSSSTTKYHAPRCPGRRSHPVHQPSGASIRLGSSAHEEGAGWSPGGSRPAPFC